MGGKDGVRWPRWYAFEAGRRVGESLRPLVQRFAYVGSYRRQRPTLGDIDILVIPRDGVSVEDCNRAFASVCDDGQLDTEGEHAFGWVRTGVGSNDLVWVNVFFTTDKSWGAALLYTTGSKAYNIAFRRVAKTRGLTVNEYAVWRKDRLIADSGFSERAVCRAIGVGWLPPEARETGKNIPVIPWESDSKSTDARMRTGSRVSPPRARAPVSGAAIK